ncbi:hypothetical protein GCM10010399_71380 [Dactylosporangium fulvum]|uniref:VOC domain-containing protein n=1 Tax=Dactylosporangium fulvum TaxID=53359 RepID=A0ABY5VYS4_9ACTN|nr:hypothetical protein [Dactylosporangium fulvum]UWP82189.1 hypothetical protein Dfulv_45185 [Dactylosporangium fulvum]
MADLPAAGPAPVVARRSLDVTPVQVNHTIVNVRDRKRSARRLAELLGVAEPVPYGPFLVIELANNCSLDFIQEDGIIHPQHYAFLVSEAKFDEIFPRIQAHRVPYWEDADGHNLEIITVPARRLRSGFAWRRSGVMPPAARADPHMPADPCVPT